MLLYSGAKWPRLALSWPAPIAPFPSPFRRNGATQAPAIEDFSTLLTCMHGMVTNCMHGTVLTCLSHSAAKQSSAGGKKGEQRQARN